jgi:diguanylate cyclase (GGDEF)-like protein
MVFQSPVRVFASVLLALLLCGSVRAQRYTFRQYGPSDGLTNLGVTSLLQDRTGYLWVGTDNGLFRYDGRIFQQFGHADGLPTDEIRALAQAPDGTLWVATQNGIARHSRDRFLSVDIGVKGICLGLAFDADGHLYVESTRGILRGQMSAPGQYSFTLVAPGDVGGLYINGNDVWFRRSGELWRMHDGVTEHFGVAQGLPNDRWGSILFDTKGNLWVRSATRLFERAKGKPAFVDRSKGIAHAMVTRLFADTHGRVFVSSNTGVVILDGDRFSSIDPDHGLPAEVVGPVLVDRNETLWMGMRGGGLIRRLGHGEWISWTKQDGLPSENIWSVLHDARGRLWVGSGAGLTLFNPDGGLKQTWTIKNGMTGDGVYALAEAPSGEIFAGTAPAGLVRFSADGKLLQSYGASSGLLLEQVNSLSIDREQYLWVAGSGGFFRSAAPITNGRAMHFERVDIPGVPANAYFHALQFDSHGNLWMTTSYGLARFDGRIWRLITEREGLTSADISAMVVHGDEVWIGYRDSLGIARIRWRDGQKPEVTNITHEDGLSSDLAYAMIFDRNGRLWVSTDNGVNLLDQGHWHHYGTEEGVIWDDGDDQAMTADDTGSVWVGTSHGLSRYTPPVDTVPDKPASIAITSIESTTERFEPEDTPVLPHAQDTMEFDFSSLDFTTESHTRYRYRLLGRKTAWTETHEGSVRFEGLPGGSYVFEVIAAGPNGLWSPTPARFAFTVKRPWWLDWWFLLLCALAVFVVGRLLWRYRVRALVVQKDRLEKLVEERTAALQESHRKLLEIAYYDALTALPNRRMFAEQFRTRLALAKRQGGSFALLLIDLDGFKGINDSHGHDIGDAVLVHGANLLRAAVRESDCVARLGGDEFAVLLDSPTDPVGIDTVCQRIVESFARPVELNRQQLVVHCSVGVSVFPGDGEDQEELYKAADIALYEAKRKGGGSSRRFQREQA